MNHVPVLALLSVLMPAAALGAGPARDITGYYRLLVEQKQVPDLLLQKAGKWELRPATEEEGPTAVSPPVVDVKNGYLSFAYKAMACTSTIEAAFYVAADKRRFVALAVDDDCMEHTSHQFSWFRDAGDKLEKLEAPFSPTFKDFLDEAAGAVPKEVEEAAGRCILRFHPPRVGTTLKVSLDGVTENTGDDATVSERMKEFLSKKQKYAELRYAWDLKAGAFKLEGKTALKK